MGRQKLMDGEPFLLVDGCLGTVQPLVHFQHVFQLLVKVFQDPVGR